MILLRSPAFRGCATGRSSQMRRPCSDLTFPTDAECEPLLYREVRPSTFQHQFVPAALGNWVAHLEAESRQAAVSCGKRTFEFQREPFVPASEGRASGGDLAALDLGILKRIGDEAVGLQCGFPAMQLFHRFCVAELLDTGIVGKGGKIGQCLTVFGPVQNLAGIERFGDDCSAVLTFLWRFWCRFGRWGWHLRRRRTWWRTWRRRWFSVFWLLPGLLIFGGWR